MKKVYHSLLCLFFATLSFSLSAQQLQWAKQMGSTSADEGLAIATDAAGNTYTTGYFQGTNVNFSPTLISSAGGRDAFIEKRDANGTLLWVRSVGGIGQEEGRGIALDNAGNVYITGIFQGTVDFNPAPAVNALNAPIGAFDAFVLKLDNAGTFVWVRSAGVNANAFYSGTITWTNIYANGIVADASGNTYIVGYFENGGYKNVLLQKLNNAGTTGWMRLTTSNALTQGWAVALDANEDVFVTGDFQGDIDFGGGNAFSTSANRNIFLGKINKGSGTIAWVKNLGGTGNETGKALKIDGSGNIYLTGSFTSTVDFGGGNSLTSNGSASDLFVGKFDNVGNATWVRRVGGTSNDTGTSIALMGNNIYLTGTFWLQANVGATSLLSAGNIDMLLSKLDASGNFIWARRMGGTGADKVNAVALTAGEDIYLTGSFSTGANLNPSGGGSPLTAGLIDAFVSKIKEVPDTDSRAVAPLTQVAAQSVALGTVNTEVFRFNITDLATSDGSPTQVNQIRIQQGTGNTVASWAGKIIDAKLYIGATEINATTAINATNINFTMNTGNLSVANASTSAMSLKITLAKTGLSNGDKFAFQIPATGHSFTASATQSSAFSTTFPALIASNLLNVDTSLPIPAIQNVKLEWVKGAGSTGNDNGNGVAVDANGNVYSVGFFNGTVDFDPGIGVSNLTSAGQIDIFIQKLDKNGNFVWVKQIGGALDEGISGRAISIDSNGNLYFAGYFFSTSIDLDPGAGSFVVSPTGGANWDTFILKLDNNGNFVWAKQIGGTGGDQGRHINIDATGNVYVTGYFQNTVDFDPGAGLFNLNSSGTNIDDIFVLKLDNNGNFLWAKSMGGTSTDYGEYVNIDATGNVYVTGFFSLTTDFDPGAGTANLSSVGGWDIFVLKLDNSGNFVWAKSMGGSGNDSGQNIHLDANGNVYTLGGFSGSADFDPNAGTSVLASAGGEDFFVQKLDNNGNFIWAKRIGSIGYDRLTSATIDAAGNIYAAGFFENTVDFDPNAGVTNLTSVGGWDIFVQKLDKDGNFIWAKSMGGSGNDVCTVTIDTNNNVYLEGYFQNTVDFDPSTCLNTLTSAGGTDIFTLKLRQESIATDKDALADLPTTQTAAQSVSMGVQDVEVFKFKIKDLGVFDCTPTVVRQIRIQQGTGNTVANWTGKIIGAKIFIGTTELSSTLTIGGTFLNFAISGSTLNIANGSDRELTIKISLASTGFANGDKLAFQIPIVSHLFVAESSGSPFATVFPSVVLSNLLTIDTSLPVPQPTVQDLKLEWVKGAGSTGNDRGHDLVLDAQGNVYTTGWFNGTVDFDPSAAGVFNLTAVGTDDIFIQKLDKDGNFVWAKRMGGIGTNVGYGINIDGQDNIYITGWFSGTTDFDPNAGVFNLTTAGGVDIFVLKLDKDGNFVWAKKMGGLADDLGFALTLDAQGNIYSTGYFTGTADFDPGAGVFNLTVAGLFDMFIQKLDTNGNLVWAKRIGGVGNETSGFDGIINMQNSIYITGYFESTVDFDPNAGVFNLTSAGSIDAFILKLDKDGNFVWAKRVGGTLVDEGSSITLDNQENIYISGSFQGTSDFDPNAGIFNFTAAGGNDGFIQKLDKDGNLVWVKQIGGSGNDKSLNITLDAQSNVYTAGHFVNTVDFDPNAGVFNLTSAGLEDIFIQKLDANGNFIFAKSMGGSGIDAGRITLNSQNNIYLRGGFQNTVDFDPSSCLNTLTSAGSYDIFTLKMRQISANTDKDALAVMPQTQVAGTLLPVGVVDESVFKFKLQDLGVYDCTPTLLRQIRIQQGAGNTVASWAGKIIAAKLFIGTTEVVGTVAMNATDIVFTITGTNLQVLNGQEREITLKFSLASTGLADGDKFAFRIPAVSSGLLSDASGSQFATSLPTNIDSEIFTITISKPLDENSVAAPTTQIPAQNASMGAIDLAAFKFVLQDEGTVDNLPTLVNQVFVQQGAANTVADWTGKIVGAKLFDGATEVPSTATISEAAITFTGLNITIANGGSKELTMKTSLANTGFANGDKIAFQIPSVSHNLLAQNTGSSQFSTTLPAKISSETITIVVLPDLIVTTAETHQGDYNNITIKATGELTLIGNISSAGTFKIEAGGKLFTNCFIVTGIGTFLMEDNTTLAICSPDGITPTGAIGNIQLTGTRTYASEASYIYKGVAAQVTGNGLPSTILNLTIDNASNVTLTNNVGVKRLVELTNGNLLSNGKLTLLSSASQTGMIVQKADGSNVVTGNATIQRHVTGGQAVYPAAYSGVGGYHYFSSPLQNGKITEFADNMPLVLNPNYDFVSLYSGAFPNFYLYRENRVQVTAPNDIFEKGWESPANSSENLVPQRGYIANVSAGTLIDFTGNLNNGTLNSTLSRGTAANHGWHLMGNPYPAPISWTAVANKNPDIHGQVLRRIPTGQYAGTWASYINGVGQNGGTDQIALGQGFFVRASTDNAGFMMDNSVRLTSYSNPTFFRTETEENTKKDGLIKLQLSQGKYTDETAIYFENGASENFDFRYDADRVQYNSSPIPSLFTVSKDNKLLAINGLPVFKDNYYIPLTFYAYTNGKHNLKLTELSYFKQEIKVFLEDKLLDSFYNLTLNPDYEFSIGSTGFVKDRFALRFTDQIGKNGDIDYLNLYPNPSSGELNIQLYNDYKGEVSVRVYDVVGKVYKIHTLQKDKNRFEIKLNWEDLPQGIYLVEISDELSTKVRKWYKW